MGMGSAQPHLDADPPGYKPPWMQSHPWMQIPQMQIPLDADRTNADPSDADPPPVKRMTDRHVKT